ncbi:MAG: AmmeMemoRadiSam system protein A, partial [Deltaproteobacteria bacterium]|nr:AmmeMemoRadiSam system protein A [Deltaproteobacteria bacterium]
MDLTEPQQAALLAWARRTLTGYLGQGKIPEILPGEFEPALLQPAGAFVSLHLGGELKGCIGTFLAEAPLVETVRDMAIAAATRDPRFRPVAKGELEYVDIEISVLSPRWPCTDPLAEVELGLHGLSIARGWARGVLLPQVATEYGWDVPTFLEHVCRKAGLPKDAWRSSDARL